MLDLVDDLRRALGLTVVATMHDLTLTAQYGDRVLMMAGGRKIAEGTADEVLTVSRIREIYGANVAVTMHEGRPVVIPRRPSRD